MRPKQKGDQECAVRMQKITPFLLIYKSDGLQFAVNLGTITKSNALEDHIFFRTRIYDDLLYKIKKMMGRTDFSDRIGFNSIFMRQSECLVINPITVAVLFNCTPMDQASDAMMA